MRTLRCPVVSGNGLLGTLVILLVYQVLDDFLLNDFLLEQLRATGQNFK